MKNLFRQEVLENKKHRLEGTISLAQPPVFQKLAVFLVIIVVTSLLFLALGSYKRKEKVSGVIQPDLGVVKLHAQQSGVVTGILVTEGQKVTKGQALVRVTSERHSTGSEELNQSLINQYQFQIVSLERQLTQQERQNKLQLDEVRTSKKFVLARLEELKTQYDLYRQRIAINENILSQVSNLATTGYISELELKRQKDTLLSLEQQSSSIQSERISLNNQLEQLNNQLAQLPIEQNKVITQLNNQMSGIKVQLASVEQQKSGELRATVDGTVSGIMVKAGKSITERQSLMTILPNNSRMQAVLYVPTSAFGFIEIGQTTKIRYQAFPYQKFGIYRGQVAELSAHVILPNESDLPSPLAEPFYRVLVDLETESIKAYGREIPLKSGMLLEADVVIEERSLLAWLFDPVFSLEGQL